MASSHHQKRRLSVGQLANAGFEVPRSRLPHLQAEASQDAAKAHLQVVPLVLHQLARRQYRSQFLPAAMLTCCNASATTRDTIQVP